MDIAEFVEATSKIELYYGKEYTNEQRQIMFDELKDFEVDRYKFLISRVIRKSKYLPKVADIYQADSENPVVNTRIQEEKVECKKCNSTGYIVYKKEIEGRKYNYAAICECGNAKEYKGWEIKDKEHRSNYYTPIAKQLGLI